MWLPTSLYKNAPFYWILLGLLMMVTSTYLATEMQRPWIYLGIPVGIACCVWGFRIISTRAAAAKAFEPELDQTCELNYDPSKD